MISYILEHEVLDYIVEVYLLHVHCACTSETHKYMYRATCVVCLLLLRSHARLIILVHVRFRCFSPT